MSTKSKALELADYLEKMAASSHDLEIIDELRRLDSEAAGHLADLEAYQMQREGLLLENKALEQERDSLRSELAAANLRIENHARLIKGYQDEWSALHKRVDELIAQRDMLLRDIYGGPPENGELFFMGYIEQVEHLQGQVDELTLRLSDLAPTPPAVPEAQKGGTQ